MNIGIIFGRRKKRNLPKGRPIKGRYGGIVMYRSPSKFHKMSSEFDPHKLRIKEKKLVSKKKQ